MSDRVAVALERIASALELIAGDMTGDGVAVKPPKPIGDDGVQWCPACDQPMVIRFRKRDGNAFFGCSTYPECTETLDIGDPSGDRGDDELPDYPPDDDSPF